MRSILRCLPLCFALPLAAQWDLRMELPRPSGQNLPATLLSGSSSLVQGDFDTGSGYIATLSKRIVAFGPIARLEWNAEYSRFATTGTLVQTDSANVQTLSTTHLTQQGVGVGLNLQLWIPFVGLGGEFGVVERFQHYKSTGPGVEKTTNLARPWLRVGTRWRLPIPVIHPYVAASYQQPITKDRPVKLSSANDLQGYYNAQGNGQEFERMWTFGVGVTF